MEENIKIHKISFIDDFKEIISLTKQAVKFSRFVNEKDIDEYATKFFLDAYKESSISSGLYLDGTLKGLILFHYLKEEVMNKGFPNELYLSLLNKFNNYKYLEDNYVYRETCEALLKEINENFDGEITLFVTDKSCRGRGFGKLLLKECLKEIESLECENIFLTSDSECNFSFYFTYGFKLAKEAKVKYKKEEITVYIESKRLK